MQKNDQYFGAPAWAPSNELFVQWMNRGQDELIIYAVNSASTVRKKQVYKENPAHIDRSRRADVYTF